MVLAALVPHVVDALVERHTRAVVDRLELDGSVRGLGYVADDMEGRQHRELVVGLARERAGVQVRRARRRGGECTAEQGGKRGGSRGEHGFTFEGFDTCCCQPLPPGFPARVGDCPPLGSVPAHRWNRSNRGWCGDGLRRL